MADAAPREDRTAFVTGATGFIGSNLIDALLEAGWRVKAFCRFPDRTARLQARGIEILAGDVCDRASVVRAMPAGVDAVFHIAGSVTLWRARHNEQTRVNVEGTRNVVTAALAQKARRLVYTSSVAAWGLIPARITEATPQQGAHSKVNYCRTKWVAEEIVRDGIAHGLDAVILNPSYTIGAYDVRGWARVIRMVALGQLPAVPPGEGSFCHARAVARVHIAAAERGRTGENYLLGGTDATFVELVRTIGAQANRRVSERVVSHRTFAALGRLLSLAGVFMRREPDITPEAAALVSARVLCAGDKAEQELGFVRVPLAVMVADCHRWLVAAGLLPAVRT